MFSILFAIVAVFVFSWYVFSGRTLIWKYDGWNQHYKALVYYAKYLRQIVRTFLSEHTLAFPDWDFSVGEGSDIVTAFHYYVIGEPINVLAAFVPTRFMHYFYTFLIILRLYLAGISFSVLCRGTGKKNRCAIAAGALSYIFCYWAIINSARHPYFLTPMIYLPLIILGVEKILRKEKPYLFAVTVALAAVSNFYFFYMIVILTVIYVLARAILLYRSNIREILATVGRVAIPAVCGAMMAGILLIPLLKVFLSDGRMEVDNTILVLYPNSYYSSLASALISSSADYWLCMGYAPPVILSLFLLFRKRKTDTLLKVLVIICAVIIAIPALGSFLNGMSYMSNRWSFAIALVCSFILVCKWEDLIALPKKEGAFLFCCVTVYYVLCLFLEKSRTTATFCALCMMFIILAVLATNKGKLRSRMFKQSVLLIAVAAGVISVSFWQNSSGGNNYASESMEAKDAEGLTLNETKAIKTLSGESHVRYSGIGLTSNASIFSDLSSTQYFWSMSNKFVSSFRKDVGINEAQLYAYEGYDERAALLSLASVKYFAVNGVGENNASARYIPYGFTYLGTVNVQGSRTAEYVEELKEELGAGELTKEQQEKVKSSSDVFYSVYENTYALPIGYCYDSYITEDVWEALSESQREETMLSTVYLSSEPSSVSQYSGSIADRGMKYTIEEGGSDISCDIESGVVVTTASNQTLKLTFEAAANTSVYVQIEGFEYDGTSEYELYHGDKSVDPRDLYNETNWKLLSDTSRESINKNHIFWSEPTAVTLSMKSSDEYANTLPYRTEEASFTSGLHDYIVNMGYSADGITSITITFPERGVYSFDSMKIINVPMNVYTKRINELREDTLQNVTYGTDTLSGTISLDKSKILCIAVPYSDGWSGYIDGETSSVYVANGHYIGLEIPEGTHTVTIKYSMPYKRAGALVSIIGFALFAGSIMRSRLKKDKREETSR